MKKKSWIWLLFLIVIVACFFVFPLFKTSQKEENELYVKNFGSTVFKFERYDFVLGQNMLVGVEKSTNQGKTYIKITEEPIIVSQDAQFLFLDDTLAFILSTKNITRQTNFKGLKISIDGGVTFNDAAFQYENERVDLITIEGLPYYEDSVLKLKCSVYDLNATQDEYVDVELIFSSNDQGFNWILEV